MRVVIKSRQLLYKALITVNLLLCVEPLLIFASSTISINLLALFWFINFIMSRNKSLSLAKLEESILREYKRVSYGQETPHYDVESIYYSDLPKELPSFLSQTYKKSIILYNYSFFEMLTFAVLQYLFTCQTSQKKSILEKIKGKICNEDFMFGSNFIKGLMIKGLRAIIDKRDKSNKPIAQILMKNEAMNAFSEFWKEIIEEESSESCVKHTDIPESLAYQYISNFIGVDFKLLRKHQDQYKEEIVASKFRVSTEPITIVMFDRNLMESIINKVFEENIGSQETERGYILLLTAQQAEKNSILPFSHEKSSKVEFDELSQRAKAVTKKGNELLIKFRQMYREMRETLD